MLCYREIGVKQKASLCDSSAVCVKQADRQVQLAWLNILIVIMTSLNPFSVNPFLSVFLLLYYNCKYVFIFNVAKGNPFIVFFLML